MTSVEEIFSQLKDDGSLTAKNFVEKLFFNDETGELNDLKNDFKSKFVKPLLERVKNLKPDEIKKITDPLGISELSDQNFSDTLKSIKDKFNKFSKLKLPDFSGFNETPREKLKDTTVENVIPENIKEKTNIAEQKTFGPDLQTIEFSDETRIFFKELFGKASSMERYNFEQNEKYLSKLISKQDELKDAIYESSDGDGLLGTLGKLLLAGGVAATLVSVFWDKIKPWLEEKFNIDLSFFDKFEGIVEGISKFFSIGGLKLALGPIPSLAGKLFTTFGELLEGGLKAIFSMGLGDDVVKAGASASPGMFKTLLPKIAGGLFKGFGLVAAKSIPILGSLISFYFAWDRYQKGDYVGAIIDVVGGLAGLIPIPIVGTALSMGLAVLNATLDMKAEGATPEERNTSKLNILKDWGKGIYNFLKEVPFVGAMIKMGEGTIGLIAGLASNNPNDVINSLKLLKETPLSFISDALLPIMDATMTTDASTGTQKINFDKMKQMIGKQVLNWFPSWMRGAAAYVFGIEENAPIEPPPPENRQENYKNLIEDRNSANQSLKENESFLNETKDTTLPNLIEQRNKIELENKQLKEELEAMNRIENENYSDLAKQNQQSSNNVENPQNFRPIHDSQPIQKVQDGLFESNEPIQLKLGNSLYETAPNDSVLAFKSGGVLDVALREITSAISDINKNINSLNRNILMASDKNNTPSVVNVNNSTVASNSNNTQEYLFESPRDAIFGERTKWWDLSNRRTVTVG